MLTGMLPAGRPPAVQLTGLALASHTSGDAGSTDMEVLARLCGHSPHQAAELLDRLTASLILTTWQHNQETDEVVWHLPQQHATARLDEHRSH
ncbi:hypothetical protein AB0D57_36260 [Streptomyces sp. NPDC048275]|uniref:hypothetical protein n=1 Tax=Streptomyces sp. NPDC048275 TaxID=3155629 RepID=UPI0033F83792